MSSIQRYGLYETYGTTMAVKVRQLAKGLDKCVVCKRWVKDLDEHSFRCKGIRGIV